MNHNMKQRSPSAKGRFFSKYVSSLISNHSYRSYQSWSKEIRDGGGLLKYNTILDFKKYLFIILSFIFGSKNFRGRKSDGKEGMFPGNYVQLV